MQDDRAQAEPILCCPVCALAQRVPALGPGTSAGCARCGAVLARERRLGVAVPAALAAAALILYVPANLYPIMRMTQYGVYSESTVWDGVVLLAKTNQWFVAAVVFMASIVVPLVKLLGIFFLAATAKAGTARWARARTRLYRFIDVVGPWAMLDVFLLAVLVALVKLGQYATVLPGPGLVAFTCVVVLTILASSAFDTRLIWRNAEAR